jgi:integrase
LGASGSGQSAQSDCRPAERGGTRDRAEAERDSPDACVQRSGEPITQVSTKAWYGGLKRAGIDNFRWHDLRHTWASWHVQSGTPLFALQELGGWESAEMVRRYAHLAADHLAPFADRLSALTVP